MRPVRAPFRSAICLFALAALGSTACHQKGDVEVLSLSFSGNTVIPDTELRAVLVTRAGGGVLGWLPWARKHYFDRAVFNADLRRIERAYSDRGYPSAHVGEVDIQFNLKRDGVRLQIEIDEGAPIVVEAIATTGFEALPDAERARLESLPVAVGQPRDRRVLAATKDATQRLLRDNGFPYGKVEIIERPGTAPEKLHLTLAATAGPQARFGTISIAGTEHVHANVVNRELTFATGDLYRARDVLESQRRLSSLQVFELTNIDADTDQPGQPLAIPVTITVTEGPHQRASIRGGYGSEEKLRGALEWSHLDFLGDARTMTVETKWSSLDRGARFNFTEPALLPGVTMDVTGGGWWVYEPAYTSNSLGGRVTLSRRVGRVGRRGAVDQQLRVAYVNESLDYQINRAALDDPGFRDDLIALGLDPDTGTGAGTLAAFDVDFDRRAINEPLDPTHGHALSLRLQHASPSFGGTFKYTEIQTEGRVYVPVGGRIVWASRARYGTLASQSSDPKAVPFSERYFLGGSTSLRGWGRYQVAPLGTTGLPLGGRTLVEISTEIRMALTRKLTGVAFVDAGNVWAGDWEGGALRYALGPGIRYQTPVGPLRADFGYQLTPIVGLVVNGQPSTRRWRIHFSIGHAF